MRRSPGWRRQFSSEGQARALNRRSVVDAAALYPDGEAGLTCWGPQADPSASLASAASPVERRMMVPTYSIGLFEGPVGNWLPHQELPLRGASLRKEAARGLKQDLRVLGDTCSQEGAGPALCTRVLG